MSLLISTLGSAFKQSDTLDLVMGGSNAVEFGFYASLQVGLREAPKWMQNTRDLALRYFPQIQASLLPLRVGTLLFSAHHLAKGLCQKYSIQMGPTYLTISMLLGCSFISHIFWRRYGQPPQGTSYSLTQKFTREVDLVSFLITGGTLAVTGHPIWLVGNLLVQLYSIWKQNLVKWADFNSEYFFVKATTRWALDVDCECKQSDLRYSILTLGSEAVFDQEACANCSQPIGTTHTSLCAEHGFCLDCWQSWLNNQKLTVIDRATVENQVVSHAKKEMQSCYYGCLGWFYPPIYYKDLPSCTSCQKTSLHEKFTLNGRNDEASSIPVSGRPERKEETVSITTLSTFYSYLQAVLFDLQRAPELQALVLKVKTYSLPLDVICTLLNLRELTKDEERGRSLFLTNLLVFPLALYALVSFTKPSVNLQEILKSLPKVADTVKQATTINWCFPFIYRVMQGIHLARLISQVALSLCKREYSIFHLSNIVAQVATLYQSSQCLWIQCDYKTSYDPPLVYTNYWSKRVVGKIQSIAHSTVTMIYSGCLAESAHLKSIVHTIVEYNANLLKGAKITHGGWGVYPEYYWVTLKKLQMSACSCRYVPVLCEMTMRVKDAINGYLPVRFDFPSS